MPLADVYGATIDKSVPGQITLTLDDVSLTLPYDGGKPTLSEATAVYMFLEQYVQEHESPNGSIWDLRRNYARMAAKILQYQDEYDRLDAIRRSLPANQRAAYKAANMDPYDAKMGRFPSLRDAAKTAAGE